MDLENAPLGRAFEGDYPESYEDFPPDLYRVLREQAEELNRIRAVPLELLGILRGRRCGRRDLPQLDVRPVRRDTACLTAHGQILMRPDAYGTVRDLLARRGFSVEREDRFVRLRHALATAGDVDAAIAECQQQGATASASYVMTTAPVGKGVGGPVPAPGLGSFAVAGPAATGEPARVAVIDTGIPRAPRSSDGWLDAVVRTDDNIDELDILPAGPDGYLDFQAGHGTFVAGVVARVAPGAEVRVYRAADTDGFAADDDLARAMIRAAEDGAQIINVSLAGRTADDRPPEVLADAVRAIHDDHDVVIVAAAGNYGDAGLCWPASLDGVEAVAGLTDQMEGAPWSSRGDVRFSTVAEGIRSVYVPGQESPVFDRRPDVFPADACAWWSGTSFAAPQIAGAVARICQERRLTARQAVDLLDERGAPVAGFGKAMRILQGVG